MKKIFGIFRKKSGILLLACVLAAQILPVSAQTAYFADDNFRSITQDAVAPVSAWDIDRSGGEVIGSETQGLILKDSSRNAAITLSRELNDIGEKSLTAEALFWFQNRAEGFCFELSDGENFVAKIVTEPKYLVLYTNQAPTEGQTLCEYDRGAYPKGLLGIKTELNFETGAIDVQINGKKQSLNENMKLKTDSVPKKIIISTPEKEEMTMSVCAVKLYGGYAFNECFLTAGTSGVPSNWTTTGTVALEQTCGANAPDLYSLGLENGASAETSFSALASEKAIYRYAFCTATNGKASFSWKGTDGANLFSVKVQAGKLSVGETETADCADGVWYDLQLNVNRESGAAKLLLNGSSVWTGSLSNTEIAGFSASADSGKLLLDDILAYEDNAHGTPTVTKAESADADVGILRCDIWREGSHIGWDAVKPFAEEREPFLGYYDDGNVWVSEWESKWLAEHGVDWQLHCWFVPKNYKEGAIKTPNNAYSLEEGFLRSENSQYLDFAIMWENTNCKDITETVFRNDIIPYWTEHYLKDSRYKTVDGKPFISIYAPYVFRDSVGGGDNSKTKENIDYLKEAVKTATGKEALVYCSDNGLSDVSALKEMGFDGIHAYNWRDNTNNAATQKSYFDRANTNCTEATLGFIPTVSGGIEETPWGRPAGARLNPANFKEVLQYAKEKNYYNSENKLVLLDSWNEIAEGHYLMPTAQDGFGYLDAIRAVTVGEGEHTDALPTDAEKAQMGTLYPKNRAANPAGQLASSHGSEVHWTWSASDLNTWQKNAQIENWELENGVLKGNSTGNDPSFFINNLTISLERVTSLEITIARTCSDAVVKAYYITDKMADTSQFTETNSAYTYAGKSGETETVYIDLQGAKDFGGKLLQLRIDPINSVGTFEISQIRLLKSTPSEMKTLSVDGEAKDSLLKIPLQEKNGEVYLDYFSIRNLFGVNSSYVAARESIVFWDAGNRFEFCKNGDLKKNGTLVKSYSKLETAKNTYILPIAAVAEALGYELGTDSVSGTVSLTAKRFYPDATYDATAASERDENGLWLYRNLAPSTDNASGFWKQSATYQNDTNEVTLSETEGHNDTKSVYKAFTTQYQRMGFPADVRGGDRLYFSAWMKSSAESTQMGFYGDFATYRGGETVSARQGIHLDSSDFALTKDWKYIGQNVSVNTFHLDGDTVTFGNTYTIYEPKFYISQSEAAEHTVYLDDINLRRIPDFAVYTKSVSKDSYAAVGAEPIEFVFSCDIDPFTVTADKITLNGKACNAENLRTELATDESTRETKLRIFLLSGEEGEKLTVALPELKDAWGRSVRGATSTTVTYSPKNSPAYVDENGSFVYDLSDITETGYTVYAAAYGKNNELLSLKSAEIDGNSASGSLNTENAEKVTFYVWKMGDTAALQPLKEQYDYKLKAKSLNGGETT